GLTDRRDVRGLGGGANSHHGGRKTDAQPTTLVTQYAARFRNRRVGRSGALLRRLARSRCGAGAGAAGLFSEPDPCPGARRDGTRVAVPQLGGTQDISLRHFIAQQGLSPREKGGTVEIMPIKNPDVLALFLRGQLDAAWVPEPWATRLVKEARAQRVVDERDL